VGAFFRVFTAGIHGRGQDSDGRSKAKVIDDARYLRCLCRNMNNIRICISDSKGAYLSSRMSFSVFHPLISSIDWTAELGSSQGFHRGFYSAPVAAEHMGGIGGHRDRRAKIRGLGRRWVVADSQSLLN
jgi:hypothetical protein